MPKHGRTAMHAGQKHQRDSVYYKSGHDQSQGLDCGPHVRICGILTLQTGLGHGVYGGNTPGVHGLWPEVSYYQ
jgi:hypothetical protein